MYIDLPTSVVAAIEKLNIAGYEAYVVGGCVRDSLMGKHPDDWDIATSATPIEMQEVFTGYRTITTGLQHGTLTVVMENAPLEITTYRIDGNYSDGRHPDDVIFSRKLSEDLKRRDFTINAMAYHPQVGLVDLYGGQEALKANLICCVGEPDKRFSEDALRILRALRFAAVLGFWIAPATENALRNLASNLSYVSVERIAVELCKLLCGMSAQCVLEKYTDVLCQIMPELRESSDFRPVAKVAPTKAARFAALFYGCNVSEEKAVTILRHLHMDNHTIRDVSTLLSCRYMPYQEDVDALRLLNRLNDMRLLDDYLTLHDVDDAMRKRMHQLAEKRCYKISMLAVDGHTVIDHGFTGPEVGIILSVLLDAVMNNKCQNEKQALIEYMEAMKKPVQ